MSEPPAAELALQCCLTQGMQWQCTPAAYWACIAQQTWPLCAHFHQRRAHLQTMQVVCIVCGLVLSLTAKVCLHLLSFLR